MAKRKISSRADQVVESLREGMLDGTWRGTLPGRDRLAGQLGVSHSTVEEAMRRLAREGWLVSEGPGRRRRIVLPRGTAKARALRVRILLYEPLDRGLPEKVELLARLQQAGFAADFATKSLHDFGMRVDRVARFVAKTPADVWIVSAGSREILEWFAEQPFPVLAMFGRFSGLPIAAASPRKTPAMIAAVRRLVALGHQRIVMLSHRERRQPTPALFEQNFLDELDSQGVEAGPYNLPDWEESPGGLRSCLDMLFRYSPPTAIFVEEPEILHAIHQFLARRRLVAPDDISLVCCDPDPAFQWCDPAMSHLRWDHRKVVGRIIRWANTVARNEDDRRQVLFDAEFVEGGTIGPVPRN